MDLHKPKPWHGLREFLKEYVIIVVGVLTALGAEQGAEWLHWQHQVEVARQSLTFDMTRTLAWDGAQQAVTPCVGARLDEIEKLLEQAQTTGRLPDVGHIPRLGRASWVLRSWSALTYGQVLGHMSNREQISLSGLALAVEGANKSAVQLSEQWETLRAMGGPARQISREEVAALRRAVYDAREQANGLRVSAERIETFALQTELLPRAQLEAARTDGIQAIGRMVMSGPLCKPIPRDFTPGGDENSATLAAPIRSFGGGDMDVMGLRNEALK